MKQLKHIFSHHPGAIELYVSVDTFDATGLSTLTFRHSS
jgi:hypothetical protein